MNMRDVFPEYFKDKAEVERIWKDCVFVFDANVIIDLYRYSDPTKESLLKSLRHYKDRVWIPRQASEEYLRNRASVIASEETYYTETSNKINEFLSSLKDVFEKRRQHPFISEKSAQDFFNAADKMKKELNANGEKYLSRVSDDEIRKEIVDIFDGRVGEGLSDEQLEEVFKEGVERYKNKTPPGYEDVKKFKGDIEKDDANFEDKKSVYGDLIIWKEIIQKSISDKKNIVLVTGDDKEDWWNKSKGKNLGPRVELIKEFESLTGNKFYMYTGPNFLSISSKEIGGSSDKAAVDEMNEVNKMLSSEDLKVKKVRLRNNSKIENSRLFFRDGKLIDKDSLEKNKQLLILKEKLQRLQSEREWIQQKVSQSHEEIEELKNKYKSDGFDERDSNMLKSLQDFISFSQKEEVDLHTEIFKIIMEISRLENEGDAY